jgi:hypothetical protein
MDIERSLLLSPLPNTDGIISFRIMEKVTFGDDKILDTQTLDVKTFLGGDTSAMVPLEVGEIQLIGRYTPQA